MGTPASVSEMRANDVVSERRLQREFLKKHVAAGGTGNGSEGARKRKFLKELKRSRKSKRDVNSEYQDPIEASEDEEVAVEEVFSELAEDEISEVDLIMEDISDEILDLQQSMNGSDSENPFRPEDLRCRIVQDGTDHDRMECTSHVYEFGSSPADWRTSRSFINEQIRRLRAQLFELKVLLEREK